ncbi:GIY-YIG nuclease family protein [Rhodopseudomonas pseudopalustris]|uniref:GIY-YIG nuclease family protein n=1 Tax=Rhodopseudomonas pseudopalustris TaxID=1513892 RepID=A0A1H8U4N9_9BRAD|nr:GIY-YIG nuclease family protein [Rhodopseudomonas pseudopalustris]SEO97804.1 hypothetical protein SAMN05444123_106271 [Rhodopseudomonas pseudopalustris]
MNKDDRKAAITAYKDRKPKAAIYAIRCTAADALWVGPTLNPDSVQNRIWFTLRFGNHPNRDLQQAWTAHGADAFAIETLELFEPDADRYLRDNQLKDRAAHWRSKLDARPV